MVKTAAKVTNLTYAEFHCGVGDPFLILLNLAGVGRMVCRSSTIGVYKNKYVYIFCFS